MAQIINTQMKTHISYATKIKQKIRRDHVELVQCILSIMLIICFAIGCIHIITDIEKFSSISQYHLLLDLNDGDQEAIDRYQYYIDKDDYLFDGPLTIHMMAEKYGLDGDVLYETYLNSEYESAQKFYNEYVKNIVITN